MNNGMSHQEFQNYLGLLSRLLRLGATQREAIEDELRAHMEERFKALTSQGVEPERAVSMALAEFGDAAALAAEFSAISKLRKRRWIMRFTIGSVAATVLLVAIVVSMLPDGSGQLTTPTAQAQRVEVQEKPGPPGLVTEIEVATVEKTAEKKDQNSQTLAKLETLGSAEFIDTPLIGVLQPLAAIAGVQMYIDHRSLDDVGITGDEPVSIHLKDLPVEMLLRLILGQFDLTYMLDCGVVIITTPEEAELNLEIRVYRVDDLVESLSRDRQARFEGGFGSFGDAGTGALGYDDYEESEGAEELGREEEDDGGGGSEFARPRCPRPGPPYDVEALMDLIKSTVDTDTWEDVGGPAVIWEFRGAIVITHTLESHRKIENLLEQLRQVICEQMGSRTAGARRSRN